MKIHIGTLSPTKIEAIAQAIKDYPMFGGAQIESFKTDSGVSEQPMTLEETILGAQNRAMNVFDGSTLSFGMESGLTPVPGTKTGYMNVTACAIYDIKEFHLGLASLFEFPKSALCLILEKGLDMSQAFKEAGLTNHEKIGYCEGVIGFLTKGRLHLVEYYKQAVTTALIHLENEELF